MKKPGFLSNLRNALKGRAADAPPEGETLSQVREVRRKLVVSSVLGVLGVNFLMFLRFFFPRALFEPKTIARVGYPSEFAFGVEEKFKQSDRVWVVRNAEGIFAIYARCTHLGCTPNWHAGENKFKCPCHGSGYDNEGVNIEGPAPRPMDRARVDLLPTGEIQVDTSTLYPFGHWDEPGAILRM